VFPFGVPVLPCPPTVTGHRDLFVLGAYPSALHVRWRPPPESGLRQLQALAVDNEPEPFWTGADEIARVDAWKHDRQWRTEWGTVEPAAGLNGPSGQWVQKRILDQFGVDRSAAWVTDCLDTYRASVNMRAAVDTVYQPFARTHQLPIAELAAHPSENQIVNEALGSHLVRLRRELATAAPDAVVTLGNAALRVFRALLDRPSGPTTLSVGETYGDLCNVTVDGVEVRWFPLAHPAAPQVYQHAHLAWMNRRAGLT